MRVTIVYDNTSRRRDLQADWGFSCFIETNDRNILFDTGANGRLLLQNMKALGVSPYDVDEIFISHPHMDHTGGLADILSIHPVRVYCPSGCIPPGRAGEIVEISRPSELHPGVYSTGVLAGIEQSLVIDTVEGLVVIVGCSHPGVAEILSAASAFGRPYALIGGFHGFREFGVISPLKLVCPTHCTRYKREIRRLYPDKYVEGGIGAIIELPDRSERPWNR